MNTFTIYGLLMLGGVCIYAAVMHLSIALRQSAGGEHLGFAGLCLAVTCAVFGRVLAYQAQTVPDFVAALRWNLAFVTLGMMLFPWVIAGFSRIQARPFLTGMAALFAVMFSWNLFAPYTLQFSHITDLTIMHLPWGETLTRPIGQRSHLFQLTAIAILADFIFALAVLFIAWRRDRTASALAMLLAMVFFLVTVIEGIATRMLTLHFIQLGWLGFLAMIITMSFVLSYETQRRLRDSERRFRSLLEQSPFSMQVFSPDGHLRRANPAWQKLWGVQPGLQASDYNILTDQALIDNGTMPYIEQGFAGNATDIPPVRYHLNNNAAAASHEDDRWLRAYIYPIRDEASAIRDVILMHEDVTNRKHVEDAIRLIAEGVSTVINEQFFQQLVINLARVFVADFTCIAVRDKHDESRLEILADCAIGDFADGIDLSPVCTPLMHILKEGACVFTGDVPGLFPAASRDKLAGVQTLIGAPLPANGHPPGFLVVMHSSPLTHTEQAKEIVEIFAARASAELERRIAESRIMRLAYQDYLTGLPNRAQLQERLSDVLGNNQQGALLLADLDHFKTINDALGHDVGDDVLRAVARRIIDCCEQDVFIARFGGDEFVALITKSSQEHEREFDKNVDALAQRILAQLANPVHAGERAFTLGASIGVVRFQGDGETDLDILRHADMALYQAKSKGRGIIQVYLPELEIAATKRLQLEAGLRSAIERNELDIYYQPQLNIHGTVSGAEALLRWHHGELGNIPPDVFIPVAEETGLIHSIGVWVFNQVCIQLTQWERGGVPFEGYISINVCPWQFARPDFVNDIRNILKHHDIDPQRLMIELTESALLYDVKETIEKLVELRKLGLRIALDDFGTGYSSLAYLRDLPLDQLKIDKNFVRELLTHIEHPLVESMVAIGRHMKLTVVAEGVETTAQHDKLIALGCEHFQGFLFCRPLPRHNFLAWLDQNHYRSQARN